MDCVQGKNKLVDARKCQDAQADWDQVGHGHLCDGRGYPFLPFHKDISDVRSEARNNV